MRILHITPYGPAAWAYGGIPRVVAALSRGLAARGHHVTVCTTDVCGPRDRLAPGSAGTTVVPPGRVDVVCFRNVSNALAYRQMYLPLGLGRYLRQHHASFDVAHLHGYHTLPVAIAARVLRQAGVPYLLAPNGTAPNIEWRRAAKFVFDRTVGRRVIPDAALLLGVTDAERRQLARLCHSRQPVRVIPNPLDFGEYPPSLPRGWFRQRHGLADAPVVLFLGRATPRKRPELMAEAVALMKRPDIRLVYAGNDVGAGRLLRRRLQRLGLESRTVHTGLLAGPERLAALADADIVVYPGEHEIFGLVAVEAVMCGTPAVVSDDSGCGEVIQSIGGGLAVPGTAEAMAAALREILANRDDWRVRVAEAQARARQRFGTDTVCAQLEQVYAETRSVSLAT